MKTKKIKLFVAILSIATLLSACSSDEPTPTPDPVDPRDQMEGTYSGKIRLIDLDDNSIYEDVVTLKVVKSNLSSDRIDFYEDADLIFYADKIIQADNGVGFVIPRQATDSDETCQGTSGYSLNGSKYDGIYSASRLECAVECEDIDGWEYQVEFDLNK